MRSVWLSLALLMVALCLIVIAPAPASAQQPGAVLIWPVNPVIDADKQAAALWLENPGKTPVTLQVRIYAWAQTGGKNVYADQQAVIGTPPIMTIAPGAKQLVRLTRSGPLICPLLSGPKLMIFWITKETWNAEQEASPGRDYRQAA